MTQLSIEPYPFLSQPDSISDSLRHYTPGRLLPKKNWVWLVAFDSLPIA